jgi:hypothetical protein
MTSIFSKAKDIFKSNDENNEKIVYYLEPTFKFIHFGVFIMMLIPITLIIVYNLLDKLVVENFANKYLETEKFNMNKKTISISEDDDIEDWDVIEYLKEKFDNFYNYILTQLIVKNHNGIQSINIRYNIE